LEARWRRGSNITDLHAYESKKTSNERRSLLRHLKNLELEKENMGGGGGAGGKPAPARGLRGAPADLKLKAGRAAALIERAVEELNMLPEDFSAARASLKNSAEALRAAAAALAGGAREGARGGLAALGQAHCLTELAMEREELAGAIEVSTRKACPGIMKDRANLYLQMAAQCTSLKAMPLFLPPVAGTGP
jgi:hypothetical protein